MEFIIIILIIINFFTVYKYLYRFFFNDTGDFQESVRYTFTPNIISLFRGEYWKDRIGEFKLGMFIVTCIIVTAIEYSIIKGIINFIIDLAK